MLKKQKGFSLVELMIVIGIIGIIIAISTPNIVTGLPKYRVKSAARDLTSKIRKARSIAVKEHRNITIVFDTANNRYSIDGKWFPVEKDGNVRSLASRYGSGVSFGFGNATNNVPGTGTGDPVSFSADQVTFSVQALSNKLGYVYLTNNRGDAYAVGIRNLAGSIALRHWTGSAWQ
jgi:prepilin-type N-terminal cleavage/methylation domain-containing protein